MTRASQRRKSSAADKGRQREAAARLASLGFGRGFRIHRGGRDGLLSGAYGRELRRGLESLGLVFSAFGLYLSSRVDLLSPQDCLELARIRDEFPAMPGEAARASVAGELGLPFERLFVDFEDEAFESRLAWQRHRARLRDGRLVEVRVLRPEFELDVEENSALFASDQRLHSPATALADFQDTLRWSMDLRLEGQALIKAAKDARVIDGFCPPRVVPECTGRNVIALEFPCDSDHLTVPVDPAEAAQRLSLVWLRQVLQGRVFPVEPRLANVAFLQRSVVFAAGELGVMPPEAQPVIWEYLNAAATDDPDRAVSYLLREMAETAQCTPPKVFAQKLRQIVPFRDGGWAGGAGQSLAEHLFLHWKLALENGYQPRPHLLQFWRGLFLLSASAHSLAPGNSALLGSLKELQTIRLLNQMQEFLDMERFGDRFDRYCMAAMELPRRTNQFLRAAEDGEIRLKLPSLGAWRRNQNRSALTAVLLLLLASTALWGRYFSATLPDPVWAERIQAAILFCVGGALLRLLLRRG